MDRAVDWTRRPHTGHGIRFFQSWALVLAIAAALGLVMVGVAADSAGQRPAQVMVEGTVRSVAPGWFDLLVEEGLYCPSGSMCPMFLTRPQQYVVTDSAVRVYSQSGARLPTADIKTGVQAVVSGQSVGRHQIAATGVLVTSPASGSCGWPDPYGPPCPAPSPLNAP